MNTPQTKKPKITLFDHTGMDGIAALRSIALAIDIWHHPVEDILSSERKEAIMNLTEGDLVEKFRWMMKQPHQTPLEFFSTVWVLENVSRAFQQQLTRHRVGFSYSIQSLRVIDVGKFADEGRYTMPNSVQRPALFHREMMIAQDSYNGLIEKGEKVEDARGLLPLNIHSPITMACSYRSLVGLLRQRLCVAAQEEWREVAQQMRRELEKVHPVFVEPLDCMCGRFTKGKGMCKTLHKPVTREG